MRRLRYPVGGREQIDTAGEMHDVRIRPFARCRESNFAVPMNPGHPKTRKGKCLTRFLYRREPDESDGLKLMPAEDPFAGAPFFKLALSAVASPWTFGEICAGGTSAILTSVPPPQPESARETETKDKHANRTDHAFFMRHSSPL